MEKKAYIYLINNNIVIVENDVDAIKHHHHAIKIVINLINDSEVLFNGKVVKQNTIIFNSDKIHSFKSLSNPIIFLLINPESEIGYSIRKKYLENNDSFFFDFNYDSHHISHFNDLLSEPQSRLYVQHFYNDIIHCICGKTLDSISIDKRIEEIFKKIKLLEDKKLPVKELASQVFLSESRFAHLFKEETKIPVRQYLAWLRLQDALKMIVRGLSFTDAAIESGFTDLPHLHKTFKHFFGVKLSEYFKNSRLIQVFDYNSV